MHFSLATIALVGLGNVLFSVNGAPTSLSQRGSSLNAPDGFSKRAGVPKIGHPDPEPPIVPGRPTNPGEPRLGEPGPSAPSGPHIGETGSSAGATEENLDVDTAITFTPKPVPKLGVGNPYKKEPVNVGDDAHEDIDETKWPKVYQIKTPNYNQDTGFVDKLGVNPDEDAVSIFNAQNLYDKPTSKDDKLFTSDIVMSVFTGEGKLPSDLKWVHADEVIHPPSDTVFKSIYKALGKDPEKDTITFKVSDTGAMKSYFDEIGKTAFPEIATRMNGDFKTGKTIQQYTLSPHGVSANNDYQDLDIFLV